MSNTFIITNIVILLFLIYINFINCSKENNISIINTNIYNFYSVFSQFIAYYLIIGYHLYNKNISTSKNRKLSNFINHVKDNYLNNYLLKTLFILNLTIFNYTNPIGGILSIIFIIIITLYCYSENTKSTIISTFIIFIKDIFLNNSNYYILLLILLLIIYYIIIFIINISYPKNNMCNKDEECNYILKYFKLGIILLLSLLSLLYILTIDRNQFSNILGIIIDKNNI